MFEAPVTQAESLRSATLIATAIPNPLVVELVSPVLLPSAVTVTLSADSAVTDAVPVPTSIDAFLKYAEVEPVSMLTATAPATLTLLALPSVDALLFESAVWLVLPPLSSDEPPVDDLAVVISVRSELAPRLSDPPVTVALSRYAEVSPNTTDTATPAPAVPPVASPFVVAFSVELALNVAALPAPVWSCAWLVTDSVASLSKMVSAIAASFFASELLPGVTSTSGDRLVVAFASILPPASSFVFKSWIDTSGSDCPTMKASLSEPLPFAFALKLVWSMLDVMLMSPLVAVSTEPPPMSILALLKLITGERLLLPLLSPPRLLPRRFEMLELYFETSLVSPWFEPSLPMFRPACASSDNEARAVRLATLSVIPGLVIASTPLPPGVSPAMFFCSEIRLRSPVTLILVLLAVIWELLVTDSPKA